MTKEYVKKCSSEILKVGWVWIEYNRQWLETGWYLHAIIHDMPYSELCDAYLSRNFIV